jgi:hypothetical protein
VSIHYFRFTLTDPADPQRAPLLERLLARADTSREAKDWRADAFRVLAPQTLMPGVGPAAWCGQRPEGLPPEGMMPGATVFMATPVHYVAEMSNVRLASDGVLSLERPEAEKLAADFKRVWGDAGVRLAVGRRADLFCIVEQSPAATTCDPVGVRGRHIENYLPSGEGAPRLRRLMSEIEMWLFEHEVNRRRSAVGVPVVNGLWLWGGGPSLPSLPRIEGWTAGNDPLFAAWTGGANAGAGSQLASGVAGVCVVAAQPGSAEWDDMESNWLQVSCRALRARRIERLELSAGYRAFSVGAGWRWRIWRRPRPWWECFT